MSRISATYRIETPDSLERAAESLAGEQSCGTFIRTPGETDELRERFAARVESVTPLAKVAEPSLPGSRPPSDTYHQGEVTISWPIENVGTNLAILQSTLLGNLFEMASLSGIKLLDWTAPKLLRDVFQGPQFGVGGTRRLTDVHDRPLIGTIIKPSVGLSPEDTANIVRELVKAGIDFIKDDELMGNPPHSPFGERAKAVLQVVNEHAESTGKRVMVALNISDELDNMFRNYDTIVDLGGTCCMISLNSVGMAATKKICAIGRLAVHGHRNGWGMISRHPLLGMEFTAYQKFWRLAGVDQIHVNGIQNKFYESDDSVVASIMACQQPLVGEPILPVVSSGQWGGQAVETFRRTQTFDLLYLAGGGIMAHPGGIAGGVRAIRDAWKFAATGMSLAEAAEQSPDLASACDKFGRKESSS